MIHLQTNIERSVYFWLESIFSPYQHIKVLDSYPEEELEVSSIVLLPQEILIEPFEFGNRRGLYRRFWTIHIYAENDTQRNDFAYKILDYLEDRINVYDYNFGFPPLNSPPQIGVLLPDRIKYFPLEVISNKSDKLFWMGEISFYTFYESLT